MQRTNFPLGINKSVYSYSSINPNIEALDIKAPFGQDFKMGTCFTEAVMQFWLIIRESNWSWYLPHCKCLVHGWNVFSKLNMLLLWTLPLPFETSSGFNLLFYTYVLRLRFRHPALLEGHLQSQVITSTQSLFLPIRHTDVSNLRHTTSERTPQVQI